MASSLSGGWFGLKINLLITVSDDLINGHASGAQVRVVAA
jgi:hypothetical protein